MTTTTKGAGAGRVCNARSSSPRGVGVVCNTSGHCIRYGQGLTKVQTEWKEATPGCGQWPLGATIGATELIIVCRLLLVVFGTRCWRCY